MTKLTWLNHAGFLTTVGEVKLVCDPWIEGTAFDDGWSLLAKTVFRYEDFARVTHIYFSHEHPDHFCPSNLKKIPEEYRRRITVLFQKTRDQRVVQFCRSLGFQVTELPPGAWVPLSSDVRVRCRPHIPPDSWLAIRAESHTILNLNDCVFDSDEPVRAVHKDVGQVDVLLTQFSYAQWVGNPGDHDAHRKHAQTKFREMRRQARILEPRYLIPFASYVWFSHQENYHMNCCVNKIGSAYEFIKNETSAEPVVLHPGDEWKIAEKHDSSAALQKYDRDYQRIEANPTVQQSKSATLENILAQGDKALAKLRTSNETYLLGAVPAAIAHVSDLGVTLRISLRRGISILPDSSAAADVSLSSEALLNCLSFDCGGDTLESNGRYVAPAGGQSRRFFRLFRVAAHNSLGTRVDMRFVLNQVKKRALVRLRGLQAG